MPLPPNIAPRCTETILLVDADPEPRKLAAFMLGKKGYTIIEARNRAEALEVFDHRGGEVDLLLIDVRGRGCELAEHLKQSRPELRVLLLRSDTAMGAKLVTDPGMTFLKKPFTMADIAGKVREILESPRPKTVMASGSP